jgi:hypothetical protein
VDKIIGFALFNTTMARKRSKKNKIEPSVLTLNFGTDSVGPDQTGYSYIDLSQVASLVNRRFYRQGINWAVAGFKVMTATPEEGQSIRSTFIVEKLPNTWIMSNAWEKGMRTWLQMSNEALKDNESARPRFMDFKVYADGMHHQLGSANNLKPFNMNGVAVEGEWDYSTIQIPDAESGLAPQTIREFDIVATGASYPGASPVTTQDAVSLIEG